MFFNYLKTSLRNLLRYKGYSLINIIGLTIGLASSILILLFVLDELSYDRFHKNFDRIYRVSVKGTIQGMDVSSTASCNPIGPVLVKELLGVEQYTRYIDATPLVRNGDKNFVEDGFLYADSTFFDIFTTRLIAGNTSTALSKPDALVLTRSLAVRYFGTTDVVGKTLQVFDPPRSFSVEGVIEDYPPNSHFRFTMLASYLSYPDYQSNLWVNNSPSTYIRIAVNAGQKVIESEMESIVDKYVGPQVLQYTGVDLIKFKESGSSYGYVLTPLIDIHLKQVIGTVYIFSLIALFLLIVASINFMNLATARASSRAREVGIRKVVGSLRSQLIGQFLTESSLLTLISFLLSILLVYLALPYFNDISDKQLSVSLINWPVFVPVLLLLLVLISLASGGYPSFFLSRFNPVSVLKGKLQMGIRSGWLRRTLVVIQFLITISLIACTLIVFRQNRFITGKDLNFDKENLLIIKRTNTLGNQSELFVNRIKNIPGVQSVTLTRQLPGSNSMSSTTFRRDGDPGDKISVINNISSDHRFIEAMKIGLVSGRFFSKEFASDSTAVVINESAARRLEWSDPVNRRIMLIGGGVNDQDLPLTIVGVIRDYNYESLHEPVKPLIIQLSERGRFAAIRYSPVNKADLISSIKSVWMQLVPNQPFDYDFLTDKLASNYLKEQRMGKIFTIFAVLAILLACLGLLGLSSFTMEKRKKEISIRKCLGATVSLIMEMLMIETVILVIASAMLASPLSYYTMNKWLQDFSYRISIGTGVFLLATLIALTIALATILYHVYRTSVRNPVDALKMD
ncbi:MAG: ABC transporter permease [Bacteroidia bacterium]|nr:ABC transporter permease [Bacteroidia bacterium]